MRFCLVVLAAFLFSGNSISQVVDQAEFTSSLESVEYSEINCYMPYEIYEGKVFSTTFTAIPKSNSGADLIILTFYAYFLDSTLFLCNDSSAMHLVQSSGYLNEHKLTLFSPVLSFANATNYPVILTRQNEKFIMHQNDTEDLEIEELNYFGIENGDEAIPIESDGPHDAYECDPAPSFPGGDSAMHTFINANLRYPADLETTGISGKVWVRFTINADGSISDITVARGLHKLLDQEAIRVISMMPKWNPGMINGKVVRCSYVVPVNFKEI